MGDRHSFPWTVLIIFALGILKPEIGWAHCDSLDGPVIQDARLALEDQNLTPILKWVREEDENEIKNVFKQTLEVRKKSPQAKELADRYFFETLVRIHRAGEGEGFTGLKPVGHIEPGILAADKSLKEGSVKELRNEISAALREEIDKRFERASALRKKASSSVKAGREYVEAYVDYILFVERAHVLLTKGVSHKHHEPAEHTGLN